MLTALKAAGYAIGWGIQFQHPGFLTLMILLLTLFACNLWGWFEFRLPGWLGNAAGRPMDGRTLLGNFATGAFVTVLATPCSAPFLGTAIGFALARGPGEIFAVFTALGLGLSLPYLAIAAVPGLTAHLPRPGRWMIALRKILALALVATAIWLLVVLALQTSVAAAILAGLTCVALAGTFALRARCWATARCCESGWFRVSPFLPSCRLCSFPNEGMRRRKLRRRVCGRISISQRSPIWLQPEKLCWLTSRPNGA